MPRAGLHRVLVRLSSAVGLLLLGVGLALVISVLRSRARQRLIKGWFRALLRSFGVRFVVHGQERLAEAGGLVVCNHVSWLDVVMLQALCPMRLLAKDEVRSWPLVGQLAGRVGTLYIDRDRLTALPDAVRAVADSLRTGDVVGAFPEGTTWCGLASGRYRPAVFQAAVDAGARVQPVAMRFRTDDGQPTTLAAFVGEATLIASVLTVARARGLVIELSLLPELDAGSIGDRRELARRVEDAIADVTLPSASGLPHLPESPHIEESQQDEAVAA